MKKNRKKWTYYEKSIMRGHIMSHFLIVSVIAMAILLVIPTESGSRLEENIILALTLYVIYLPFHIGLMAWGWLKSCGESLCECGAAYRIRDVVKKDGKLFCVNCGVKRGS